MYDNGVVDYAKTLKPSKRGELEITDINNIYLKQGKLKTEILGRGFAWLDTGTVESLHEAAEFVRITETRQSVMISAPEEIAFIKGWISEEQLKKAAEKYGKSLYGQHLKKVAEGKYRY